MTPIQNAEAPVLSDANRPDEGRGRRRSMLLRLAPFALMLAVPILSYAFGLTDYVSFEALSRYRGSLAAFVAEHGALAAAVFFFVYVVTVAVSFPGAGILTITGGFLFGAVLGTALASVAATIGATLVFLIAQTSVGAFLAERAGLRTRRLREGFQEEGFSYLLFLRLVPLFPFWLVNLAAALFGMKLLPYVAATAVGVVPATFVFAYFGRGLATALESDGPHVPYELLAALTLLGFLALLPAIVRRRRAAKAKGRK